MYRFSDLKAKQVYIPTYFSVERMNDNDRAENFFARWGGIRRKILLDGQNRGMHSQTRKRTDEQDRCSYKARV